MKSVSNIAANDKGDWDAVFLQSRRELIGILLIWLVFAAWVLGAAYFLAYAEPEGEVPLVLGMPAWVFWAVGVPWLGANIVIIAFCMGFMKDQSLDGADDPAMGTDSKNAS